MRISDTAGVHTLEAGRKVEKFKFLGSSAPRGHQRTKKEMYPGDGSSDEEGSAGLDHSYSPFDAPSSTLPGCHPGDLAYTPSPCTQNREA